VYLNWRSCNISTTQIETYFSLTPSPDISFPPAVSSSIPHNITINYTVDYFDGSNNQSVASTFTILSGSGYTASIIDVPSVDYLIGFVTINSYTDSVGFYSIELGDFDAC